MGALEHAWNWARRRPAIAALLLVSGVSLLLLVGGAVGLLYHGRLQEEFAKAQQAKEAEENQRARAEAALRPAERYRYFHHIALAHAGLRDGNVGEAERLLDDCPEEQRRWEWQHLKRLCHAELLTLEGHTDWVWRLAFSPDGRRLASAGQDQTVKVWDVTTGRLKCSLTGHTNMVCAVAFSPDGTQLASGGDDGTVRIWDVMAERELRSFQIKLSNWSNLAFSPNWTRLAAVSGNTPEPSQLKVWDPATGKEILAIPNSSGAARAVSFSPDGKKLAWGAWDRSIRVWDLMLSKFSSPSQATRIWSRGWRSARTATGSPARASTGP